MENSPPLPLAVALLLALAGSLLVWTTIALRRSQRQPILAFQSRRLVPWGGLHIVGVLLAYLCLQIGSVLLVTSIVGGPALLAAAQDENGDLDPGQEKDGAGENEHGLPAELLVPLLLANAVCSLVVVGLTVVLFRASLGATGRDFGFLPWRPGYDVPVGIAAFLAAMLPVYAIQAVLTQFFPSEHPVTTLLAERSDLATVLVCIISAVIAAPLAEEFLFRGVLQGWLEAAAARWSIDPASALADSNPAESIEAEVVAPTSPYSDNPYRAPQTAAPGPAPVADAAAIHQPGTFWQQFLPIAISSLLFALVHLGHGPDPIPLFVLALILGYVYQRTHRLWPCIVLHACLNATSLIVLFTSVDKP